MKTLAAVSVMAFPLVYLCMLFNMSGRSYPWMMGICGIWLLWGTYLYTVSKSGWALCIIVMSVFGMGGIWFLIGLARAMMR